MLPDHVIAALPPGDGFLQRYVAYAAGCSDAPVIYHMGVGLTILSSVVAKKLACPWLAGRPLVPNLYTLLVGPSRSSRKSASTDAGVSVLQATDISLVTPIPGSYEELIAQIRRKPQGLLTYREFGHFLKSTMRGYGESIRTALMDLFDWPPDRPYTRNLKKGATVIEPPICLSMLGAVSTELLHAYSDLEDWTGGFMGRMLLLYGERGEFRMPMTWPEAYAPIVQALQYFAATPLPACGGFDENAWRSLEAWSRTLDTSVTTYPVRVQTFVSGAPTLAVKIALLYAANWGAFVTGHGWLIPYEVMLRALAFVNEFYLPSIRRLGERLALGPWERDRLRVLDIIERNPGGVSRRDTLRQAKMSSEYLETVINTLKEEGTIVQGQDARGIIYRMADGAVVLPFPKVGSGSAGDA